MTRNGHGAVEGMEWSLTGLPLPVFLRPPYPLTDEEFMVFSRKNRLYRVEKTAEGDLHIMTPVGGDGGQWEAFVIRELGYWAEDHGGRYFSSNAGFNLPDGSTLSPDTAWVSESRWQALSANERASFPPLCPDFLIEVLSDSDSKPVLEAKMHVWMKNGAKLAWMIDPYAATVTIYRPGCVPEALVRPDSVEAGEPVPGFRLTMAHRWPAGA